MSTASPRATKSTALRMIAGWWRPIVLVVVVTGVYSRGLGGGLLESWDDNRFIIDNALVNEVELDSLISMFTRQHFEAYHPLHLLSYWLDVPWFGHGGPAIHAVSLILWLAALLALLALFDRLGLPPVAALLAALFFGVHPVQVEAVTWASGRKDVLAALFSILAFRCHLGSAGPNDRGAWGARGLFVLAALSKTTTLVLPGVLFLWDVLERRLSPRRALLAQAPSLIIAVVLSALVLAIWRDSDMIRPDTIAGPATRFAASVTHHVVTAVAPFRTAAAYPVNRPVDFAWTAYIVPALLLVGAVSLARARLRRGLFAALSFLVLLLPVSNIVPMYWHWMDRYLSLPLLPVAFAFGLLLSRATGARRSLAVSALVAAIALVAALCARTAIHHARYTDDAALWEHAVAAQPEAFLAWKKRGELGLADHRPREAIEAFERAVGIEPGNRLANANLLQAHSLLDEEERGLSPSRIDRIGARYLQVADDPDGLEELAATMERAGYEEGTRFVLRRLVALVPMSRRRLLSEALARKRAGSAVSYEFFMSELRR